MRRLDDAEVTTVTSLYVFTLLVVKQVEKSKKNHGANEAKHSIHLYLFFEKSRLKLFSKIKLDKLETRFLQATQAVRNRLK